MRRTSILVAGAAIAAVVVAGCGGSDSNPQVDAITESYNTYIAAVKSGNGKLACSQLTPAYARIAARQVPPNKQAELRGASCPKVIRLGTPAALQKFEPNLTSVEIKGDRGSGFDPGEGIFASQKVLFRRLGGEWKIAGTLAANGRLVG
jgi:hypothetical protein